MTEQNIESAATIGTDSVVTFHYRMCEVDDAGNNLHWLENSYDADPVSYLHGHNNIIAGIEKELEGKGSDIEVTLTVEPEQAYGLRQDVPVKRVPIKHLFENKTKKKFRPGDVVTVQTEQGARNVTVIKAGKFNVDVDLNHPFAGKKLYYDIKIVEVRDATPEEKSHGHSHGVGGHQH